MAGLTDPERARILELHEQGLARNEIARLVDRSGRTVSRVVAEAGGTFERSAQTEAATKAQQEDNRRMRARLQALLLEDAMRIREQLWEPAVVYNFGGRDNTYEEHTLDRPDFAGQNAIMRTVGVAIDKAVKLAEADREKQDAGSVVSLLGALVDGLRDEYGEDEDDATDPESE